LVLLESFPDECRNTKVNLEPRIIIPDCAKEPSRLAKVLAVGDGKMQDGQRHIFEVAVGDTVLCRRYGGAEAKAANGQKYFFMRDNGEEILAKVNNGS
jgi:co-chaperonin GroES (HSP10)